MAYFSLVLLSISLVGLPAILRTSRRARGFSKLHARVVIAAWIAVIIWSALSYPKDVKAAVGRLSASVLSKDARHPWTVLKQGWIDAGEPLSLIRKQLSATSWSQLTREIQRLDREGRVVVHVKDGNQEFWRRLQGKSAYWCMSAHLMLPAQTGIVQVKSVAPASIEAECSWGALPYYGFGRNQGLHRSSGQSNDALCSEARMLGARRVYLVNSISNLVDNTVLECGS
jgi:hypothetical protein